MKLTETEDGTVIEVFVKPNQPKFKIAFDCDEIVVYSTQEPVKGKVNKEIVKEFSRLFRAEVELISGSASKQKRLMAKGLKKNEAERVLQGTIRQSLSTSPSKDRSINDEGSKHAKR